MQRLALGIGILILIFAAFMATRVREEPNSPGQEHPGITTYSSGSSSDRQGAGKPSRKSSEGPRITVPRGSHYSGPNSLAEWTVPQSKKSKPSLEGWNYADGTLNAKEGGAIAREIPTSAMSRFSFHLTWKNSLRFRVLFFADQGDNSQPNICYDLVIHRRFVYLRKRWMNKNEGGSRILGQANIAALASGKQAFFELYFYREDGTIALFFNGDRQHIWTDQDPGVGEFGDWFQFITEDFFPTRFSQITVDRWDGTYPDTNQLHLPNFKPNPIRVLELTPPDSWGPTEIYRRERAEIRTQLHAALTTAEGPARQAAHHAAISANVEAQRRYNQAHHQLPEAKANEPGFVINPFTGESLDVRGILPGSRIWDPRTGRPDQIFRIP